MKRILTIFVALSVVAIMPGFARVSMQSNNVSKRVIIKLKQEIPLSHETTGIKKLVGINKIDKVTQEVNPVMLKTVRTGKKRNPSTFIIELNDNADIQYIIEQYMNTGEVEYAEPDYIGRAAGIQGVQPNDTKYSLQWGLNNNGTFTLYNSKPGADINMESGWNITQGSSDIIVAVIDTGTKLNHPELSGRIWTNPNETTNLTDSDGNGYVDDIYGWDFANNDNDPSDDHGHGTNVIGIIGANGNNNLGFAGVDWNCKLMNLKALTSDSWGYYSWWSEAIYYAVDNGAKVINMSLGGTDISSTLHDAVNYALDNDVVVVACMMNANTEDDYFPAAYPGVIAVGATNPDDTRAVPFFFSPTSGSNYGNHISVVAPGNYIYGLSHLSNTNYSSYWGGTSQAAPHVAGLASLMLSINPNLTPSEIKLHIEQSADDQTGNPSEDSPGWDKYYGHGRINAGKTLSVLTGTNYKIAKTANFTITKNYIDNRVSVNINTPSEHLLVFNATGQIVHASNISGKETVSFSLPQRGVYLIQLSSDNQKSIKKITY